MIPVAPNIAIPPSVLSRTMRSGICASLPTRRGRKNRRVKGPADVRRPRLSRNNPWAGEVADEDDIDELLNARYGRHDEDGATS